jgi:hypothetical protein
VAAWIRVHCVDHPPYAYGCDWHWRFDIASVDEALSIARASYPDAHAELTAQVVIDCEHGQCVTRLVFPGHVPTIARAREITSDRRRSGWFTVQRGRRVVDHCQFHTEPLHVTRRAAAVAVQEDQGSLF